MKRMTTLVFLAALAVAAPPVAQAAASAPEAAFLTCAESGHPRLTPGLTMSPRPFTFDEHGTVGPCAGPGGQGLTGKFTVLGARGEGSCTGIHFAGLATFAWSDGTVSKVQATGQSVGTVILAGGEIVSGRFAGALYRFVASAFTSDPLSCASSGLSEVDVRGSLTFSSG